MNKRENLVIRNLHCTWYVLGDSNPHRRIESDPQWFMASGLALLQERVPYFLEERS